jgi:hypothetical protein
MPAAIWFHQGTILGAIPLRGWDDPASVTRVFMATRFLRRTALYVGLSFAALFSPVISCSQITQAQTSVTVEPA